MYKDHFISDFKQLPVLESVPEVKFENLSLSKILEFFTDSFDILKSSCIYGGLVRITSATLKKARHCSSDCNSGFSQNFCHKTCGTCESWTPEHVGDISYLDDLGPDNCEDKNDACAFWAATNQCMVNPVSENVRTKIMLHRCPKIYIPCFSSFVPAMVQKNVQI